MARLRFNFAWDICLFFVKEQSECIICGHPDQTVDHMFTQCTQGPHCTDEELRACTDEALDRIRSGATRYDYEEED